jgi:hypothetical protein
MPETTIAERGRLLVGVKSIAGFLGIDLDAREGRHARDLVRSWVSAEKMPASFLHGRWYAYEGELREWWESRRGKAA